MNDVLMGAAPNNKAVTVPSLTNHNESLRVQCEAPDCGALLEIEVPSGQYQSSSLIVRCGNCSRLLSVWLRGSKGQQMGGDGYGGKPQGNYPPPDVPMDVMPMMQQHRREGVKPSPLMTMHLARPPPLSRAQAMANLHRENGVMGDPVSQYLAAGMGSATMQQMKMPLNSMMTDQGTGYYGAVAGGNGIRPEAEVTKRGSGGKAKKDRGGRHASPYNRFMSQEVKRIKAENPDVDHRKAFKMAASNWARSPTDCQKLNVENDEGSIAASAARSPASITESNDVTNSQGTQQSAWNNNASPPHQNETTDGGGHEKQTVDISKDLTEKVSSRTVLGGLL